MKYVLTPEQMRGADKAASEEFGIPPILLMENAARSAYDIILPLLSRFKYPSVAIFCGNGNNGGDGFALARHLAPHCPVQVYWIGEESKMSGETQTNYRIAQKLLPVTHLLHEQHVASLDIKCDCVIDALIGVGGSENLHGLILPLLQKFRKHTNLKIALDIPTGLNATTGLAHKECFLADHTITMGALKTGLLLHNGLDVSGKTYIADFGLPSQLVETACVQLERSDVRMWLPKRKRTTSKYDYGKVVLIGGSLSMPGAIALAANASMTIGAGLVRLFTPCVHSAVKPEIMPVVLPATSDGTIASHTRSILLDAVSTASVVVLGPGLGRNQETIDLCREVLLAIPPTTKAIIDAEGLLCIRPDDKLGNHIILTPHVGEFARLTGMPRDEVQLHGHILAGAWAQKMECIILLKHIPSIITDGVISYWNIHGNPGMAKGGSGDVLSGIIAGLAAQGLTTLQAGALGAFLHAAAGDAYVSDFAEETLTASEIINYLQHILHGLENEDR